LWLPLLCANAVPNESIIIITTATSSTEMRLIVIVSPTSSFFFFWARAQASGALLRLVRSYPAGARL
jgi:hypothetical protein